MFPLDALAECFNVARLPFPLKLLLENQPRSRDGKSVTLDDIEALAARDLAAEGS